MQHETSRCSGSRATRRGRGSSLWYRRLRGKRVGKTYCPKMGWNINATNCTKVVIEEDLVKNIFERRATFLFASEIQKMRSEFLFSEITSNRCVFVVLFYV